MSELVKNAAELATTGLDSEAVTQVLTGAGGFVLKEAGSLVVGGLVARAWERLCEEYQRSKEEGKIPPEYEETDHGAKLLQEALRALSGGLSEDQADAVRAVFLGLASTQPGDALERVQQISILETTASLTPWEIMALNLLERISKQYYEPGTADWLRRADPNTRGVEIQNEDRERGTFGGELDRILGKNPDYKQASLSAITALEDKMVLRKWTPDGPNRKLGLFVCDRKHWFSEFGWKLAVQLYSIDVDTD